MESTRGEREDYLPIPIEYQYEYPPQKEVLPTGKGVYIYNYLTIKVLITKICTQRTQGQ
jgi:hypothetical protein